jgi:isoamylase
MLLGGDEMGRTQRGNNNAYGQDNELSWFNWGLTDDERALLDFTIGLIGIFRAHPVLHRRRFLQGRRIRGSTIKDLTWYGPDGSEMSDEEWGAEAVRALGLRLAGSAISEPDEHGRPIVDDTLLLILNADEAPTEFRLPSDHGHQWELLIDTTSASIPPHPDAPALRGGDACRAEPRSLLLLRQQPI